VPAKYAIACGGTAPAAKLVTVTKHGGLIKHIFI